MAVTEGCDAGRMAARQPITRQPSYLAAWVLLVAAQPVLYFGPLTVGLLLFVASLAALVLAVRHARRGTTRNRYAPKLPPQ